MSDSKRESVTALPSDRAVVNGAASVSALRASVPSAWSFKEANAFYRIDVRQRMLAEAINSAPMYKARNPAMTDDDAFYASIHGAVMSIIDQLFPNDENDHCPTVCTSDVAWEVMYALGFHEAQAIEARRAATGTGAVHESAVGETDAPETPGISNIKDKTDG